MFMDTLSITDRWLRTIKEKLSRKNYISPDRRGIIPEKRKTIPSATIQSIKDHINSVPRVESHYVRQDTAREFFEETLSITQLHKIYLEWLPNQNPEIQAATYRQYADIFNNSFNIDFHKPKKDQCDSCVSYKNCPADEK